MYLTTTCSMEASSSRPARVGSPLATALPLPCRCSVMHSCLSSVCFPSYQELTRQETEGTLTHQHDRDACDRVYCWADLLKPQLLFVVPCPPMAPALGSTLLAGFLVIATGQTP